MTWEIEFTDEFGVWWETLTVAILLIGGDKTGDNRWYDKYVPMADDLYDEHVETLKREGLL